MKNSGKNFGERRIQDSKHLSLNPKIGMIFDFLGQIRR